MNEAKWKRLFHGANNDARQAEQARIEIQDFLDIVQKELRSLENEKKPKYDRLKAYLKRKRTSFFSRVCRCFRL